jgi:hypothetical protein
MLLVKALRGRRFETLSWIDKLDYCFGAPIAQNSGMSTDQSPPHAFTARFHLVKPILLICT